MDQALGPQPSLDELFDQSLPATSRGAAGRAAHLAHAAYEPPKYEPGHAIKHLRYSHDAMIDLLIERPMISQNELAAIFGYTPGWTSQVMSSDAFKAKLEMRRDELVDPTLRMTLNEKFAAMVNRSIDVVQNKLADDHPDPEIALRAIELGAKAMGMGGNRAPTVVINDPDRLTKLADRLKGLMQPPQGVYDVQAIEVDARQQG